MINRLCVYDYETDGAKPEECQPVQLAACIIHPVTLDIIEDSYFSTYMRPDDIDDEDYYEKHLDTITWHAKNYKTTPEAIFKIWKDAPDQKTAWNNFTSYLAKYNQNPSKPNRFGAPARAGMNIRRFDNVITDRLCKKYGNTIKDEQSLFHPRDTVDIMDFALYWFESLPEPQSYNMEALRKFFGLKTDIQHDALNDVKDEAWIIRRFLKLHRNLAPRVQFRND